MITATSAGEGRAPREAAEMRGHQRRVRKAFMGEERRSNVDDGHREAQVPAEARQRLGIRAGAEDHELRRRQRDVEEHLGATDLLPILTPEPSRRARARVDSFPIERVVAEAPRGVALANEQSPLPSRQALHQHGSLGPADGGRATRW